MKTLRLADDLSLPIDAITRTFGIFGQRGTGKSTTAAVLVEQAVKAGGRAVALDPTGVWFGLTREGEGPGLPGVVLGGEHQDAPLEAKSGAIVADFVMGSEYPFVALDLKLLRKHERQHFAMEFLEALYHENRDPLMVVFDEAAQFAPQQMREKGDVPRLLGAVEDLVKLGRSRGLGAVMIEQRIATLNANVREQIETLVAHRLIGPLDRKALREWIAAQGEPEREAEALAEIPKLATKNALVWSPSFLRFFGRVAIHNATTFDSRATPEVGKRRRALTARAPVDLAELQRRMGETIEKAKADDPKTLRAEIDRLTKELRKAVAFPNLQRVEIPAFQKDELKALEKLSGTLEKLACFHDIAEAINALARIVSRARGRTEAGGPPNPTVSLAYVEETSYGVTPNGAPKLADLRTSGHGIVEHPRRSGKRTAQLDALGLKRGARRMLVALSEHPTGLDRVQAAALAGLTPSGGSVGDYLSALASRELISRQHGLFVSTDAGRRLASEFVAAGESVPGTRRELVDLWKSDSAIKAGARAMLEYATFARGGGCSREDLAEAAGMEATGGSVGDYLSALKSRGLIDKVEGLYVPGPAMEILP